MNVPMTPELADVLSRPSVAAAIPAAERKAQDQVRTIFARGGRPPADPGVPQPQPLDGLVGALGGVQDSTGAFAASGLGHLVTPPGRGLGADAVRQIAAQAGYFGPDAAAAARGTTVDDLRGALASGRPVHSAFDRDAAQAWAARDAAAGASGGAPQLTPEGIDCLKRALGDRVDAAQRAGNRDDARIYTGLQRDLLGAVERHPDPSVAQAYGAARRAYAGPSREMEALNAGRAAFGDNVTPEQVQREFGALGTDAERQRYRDGLFSAGRDKLARAGDTRASVDMVAGNDAIRAKFDAVAPHQGALDTFNAAMDQARQRFTQATRPTPEALHATLGSLDARAARTGDPGAVAARNDLAAHLGQDPYYAYGRAQDQSYAGLLGAMDQGRTALRSGPNAVNPADFADRFAGRTGAGQEAERVAMHADLDSQLRQSRDDYRTMSRMLQGEDGFNAAKVGTAFGDEARARLLASLLREDAYKANQRAVMGGSQTGERQAVRELTQPDVKTGFLGYLANMRPLDQPATVLPPFLHPQNLGELFYAGRYEAARNEVAPLLVSQDRATTDPILDAIIRIQGARAAVQDPNTAALVKLLAAGAQGGRRLVQK